MNIFNFFSDIKIEIDNLDSFIKKSEQYNNPFLNKIYMTYVWIEEDK